MEIKKKAIINSLHNKLGEYGRIELASKLLLPHIKKEVDVIIVIPD